MLRQFFANPVIKSLLVFLLLASIASGLATVLKPVLIPLIVSFVLYALLEPMTGKLVGRGFSQSAAIATILIGVVALITVSIVLFFPIVLDQIEQFQKQLPALWAEISKKADELANSMSGGMGLQLDLGQMTSKWFGKVQESAATVLVSSAGFILKLAIMMILVPLITFFLLRDFRTLRGQIMGWLPNNSYELGWLIYYRVTKQLQKYIRGVLIQSFIVALVVSIGFFMLG
ncbi:MAG: AI-2E family transporter, partial [Proteobacteria bacterium]|nr:AI-2E family transporter [Pseudomonadota bacterium]MBU1710743.1 AI-2E family transporter [Pseudomonadota bacterium]